MPYQHQGSSPYYGVHQHHHPGASSSSNLSVPPGFHSVPTLSNQRHSNRPTRTAQVERHFNSSGSVVGTSASNYGPDITYLQRYIDAVDYNSMFLPQLPTHHHFHYPTPLMQPLHGNSYNYHPQVSMPSSRHPANLHQVARNPSGNSRLFQPIQTRTSHSYQSRPHHHTQPYLRCLPHDEVAIIEIPGFHQVEIISGPTQEMPVNIENISYEGLLALGTQIGNVKAGLSEEDILTHLKTKTYCSSTEGGVNQETCIVCQEEYENQEQIGSLKCGHEYHAGCITKWLQVKDMCPMCKAPAFTDEDN